MFRETWIDGGGANSMVSPSAALTARMTHFAVGGRRSHPRVSISALHCAVTKGQRSSTFLINVAMLLSNPVSPEWSCWTLVIDVDRGVRWLSGQRQNLSHVCFSARCKRGTTTARGAFTSTYWNNLRMLLQLAAILSVLLHAVASFSVALSLVYLMLSSLSVPLVLSLFDSSATDYNPRSEIFTENFLRSPPVVVSPSRTTR